MVRSNTTSALRLRIDPAERALLKAAATRSQMTLREFIRRKAVEAAETEIVFNASVVTIPAADWKKFEAWVKRPAGRIAALTELGRMTPTWEQ